MLVLTYTVDVDDLFAIFDGKKDMIMRFIQRHRGVLFFVY